MMPTTRVVQWLLVGTGDVVRKRVAAALASGSGGRLAGICGGLDRARAIAGQFGADEAYEDLDQALAATRADSVYIATPVHRHAEEALKALAAGKHVLVEKPLGLQASDARRIVQAAEASGRCCGCAYYRRLFPRFAHLKHLLDSRALGRIVVARTSYLAWFKPQADDPKAWRVRPAQGRQRSSGRHGLPYVGSADRSVRHAPERLCQGGQPGPRLRGGGLVGGVDDARGRRHAIASFGWGGKTWLHDFEVIGSEAGVRWSPADTGDVVLTEGRNVQELEMPSAANVHLPLIEDFNRAVLEGRQPAVPSARPSRPRWCWTRSTRERRDSAESLIERENHGAGAAAARMTFAGSSRPTSRGAGRFVRGSGPSPGSGSLKT